MLALNQVVPSGAEQVVSAVAGVVVGFHFAPGQGRVMCDPGFATERPHAGLPLGTVGARAARPMIAIHERVGDFVCHGGGEVGVPVKNKGLRVEAQLLLSSRHPPLARCAPFQVETHLRDFSLRSRLVVKFAGLFENSFLLFIG